MLPPLPEKEPIWRRANVHPSPTVEPKGRYAPLEQQERLARPRPKSYLELEMEAEQSGRNGGRQSRAGSPLPELPPVARRRRPVAACCWLLSALLVGAAAASLYRVRLVPLGPRGPRSS